MKNSFPAMTDRMLRLDPYDFAVSSITLFELEYGAAKSKWGERTRDDLYAFLSPFAVLPFDPDDAIAAGTGQSHRSLRSADRGAGVYTAALSDHAQHR